MSLRLDGFRLQLFALIVLPLSLLLLALAFAGTRVHGQTMRRLVAERDERAVRAAAEAIGEGLRHRQRAVRVLALRLQAGTTPQTVLEQAAEVAPELDGGIAVLDPQGRLIGGRLRIRTPVIDLAGRLRESTDPERPLLAESADAGGDSMAVVGSTVDRGTILGAFAVAGLVRPPLEGSVRAGSGLRALVVDELGRTLLIQGEPRPGESLADHRGVEAALRGMTGSTYEGAADGERVIAFSPIRPAGWALVAEEPWADVASPLLSISMSAPLALAPALIAALTALWFGASRVIVPLRKLGRLAEQFSRGRLDAVLPPVGGVAEIQELQRTLGGMAKSVMAAQEALHAYIGRITDAQEEERRRIARELHDETVQQLIALDQRLQLADAQILKRGRPEPGQMAELRSSLGKAIRDVRRLSRGLRPDYLEDLGLSAALEVLARETQSAYGIPIAFEARGSGHRFPAEVELAVFRVAQEALSNVGRHASAARAKVSLSYGAGGLRLSVNDEGKGFDPPADLGELGRKGHFGLIGLFERTQSVGGRLSLISGPGRGTRVELIVPRSRPTA